MLHEKSHTKAMSPRKMAKQLQKEGKEAKAKLVNLAVELAVNQIKKGKK